MTWNSEKSLNDKDPHHFIIQTLPSSKGLGSRLQHTMSSAESADEDVDGE